MTDLRAAIARVRDAIANRFFVPYEDIALLADAAERAAGQPVAWLCADDERELANGSCVVYAVKQESALGRTIVQRPLYAAPPAPASDPQAEPQPEAIPIAPVEVVRQALKELLESISECRMDQVTARFAKASVMARAVVDRYKDET